MIDVGVAERLPLLDVGDGEVEGSVDVAVLHGQQARLPVGDRGEDDPLRDRLRPPVVVAGFQHDPVGRRELDEPIGAGAERQRFGRADVLAETPRAGSS